MGVGIFHLQPHSNNAHLTLDNGIPGIIWFLLNYLDRSSDTLVSASVTKALHWLIKKAEIKKNNTYIWPIIYNSRSSTLYNPIKGTPGITLVLTKAYEILKESNYRQIAEANLKAIPAEPVIANFTLSDGVAGLGELYLNARYNFRK